MHPGETIEPSALDRKITDFLSRLSQARSRALLLDYDGTLAPFTVDAGEAYPYPEIPGILHCIQLETDTRVIIVTGRRAAEIPRLLGLNGLEIWGCHGCERLAADGSTEIARIDASLLAAIETANCLIASEGLSHLAERKIASIAIHWRGKEDIAEQVVRKMRHVWSIIPDRSELRFAPFDGGIEIRAANRDKGDAVRATFREMGPDVAVAYLGDDETDEDGFGALTRRGLNILVRNKYRPTLADAWIRPPEELIVFLRRWISACRSSQQFNVR